MRFHNMFISKERRISAKKGSGIQYIPGHIEPFTDLVVDQYLPKIGGIVDLGGGGLRFAVPVAQKGRDITVVDADNDSIDLRGILKKVKENKSVNVLARQLKPHIKPVVGDILDFLKSTDNRFGLITCFRVIHFFPPAYMETFFAQVARRLVEGGILAVSGMTTHDLDRGGPNEILLCSTPIASGLPLYREFDSSEEAARIQREQNLCRRIHLIDDHTMEKLADNFGFEVLVRSFKATRIVQGYILRRRS